MLLTMDGTAVEMIVESIATRVEQSINESNSGPRSDRNPTPLLLTSSQSASRPAGPPARASAHPAATPDHEGPDTERQRDQRAEQLDADVASGLREDDRRVNAARRGGRRDRRRHHG